MIVIIDNLLIIGLKEVIHEAGRPNQMFSFHWFKKKPN